METYYKYRIVFALIVISMLILNPMTVHSQSLTIQGSERSEESGSTTATKPGEEMPSSISMEPHCIDDILAPDCIPVCPPDCLSGEGIRLTIDTGDGNPKTIRGDKDQILEQMHNHFSELVTSIQHASSGDDPVRDFEKWIELTFTPPIRVPNSGVSINCKVSATDIGTNDTGGTVTCAFIESYPIKWEGWFLEE